MSQRNLFLAEIQKLKPNFSEDKDFCNAINLFLKDYPENAYDVYIDNPYILTVDYGLSFTYFHFHRGLNDFTKSKILVSTFDMHLQEVYAAIWDILRANEMNGNSYLSLHDMYIKLRKFFSYTSEDRIRAFCHYWRHVFSLEEDRIAFLKTKKQEEYIYQKILPFLESDSCTTSDFQYTDVEELCGEQNDAVRITMTSDLSILTGGPGSGKTTTIRTILASYVRNYPDATICLLAPTGKAARRLSESVQGYGKARTIDSLTFRKKILKEERESIDFCIIDESSMLSIQTFHDFLRYINPKKILLVGDIDQLPSIGAGDILRDLMNMGVTTARLTINHRSGDTILNNSYRVKRKEKELIYNNAFRFVDANRNQLDQVAASFRRSEHDIILTPYCYEAININTLIHKQLYQNSYDQYEIGDKVMFLKNNRKSHWVNGDTGTVVCFREDAMVVALDDMSQQEVYVTPKLMDQITYAYSMTVHKSQGSEYQSVIICLPTGCGDIFSRKLLYTAITRAKENVIFVGDYNELIKLIQSNHENNRQTFLADYKILDTTLVSAA